MPTARSQLANLAFPESPEGTLHAFQPNGRPGLLVCDRDRDRATRQMALRLRESSAGESGK